MRDNSEYPNAKIDSDPENEEYCIEGLQIREIAMLLGISRSRVVQIEQVAIAKIRNFLKYQGIEKRDQFDILPVDSILTNPFTKNSFKERPCRKRKDSKIWIPVTTITSINSGSVTPWDVVRAFAFIRGQRKHEKLPYTPVFHCIKGKVEEVGYITGLNVESETLLVCIVKHHVHLDSKAFVNITRSVAIVDSIFDTDQDGNFDIPILKYLLIF